MGKQPPHDCPGRCGQLVAYQRLSCPACWLRLPADLRNAISGSYHRRRTDPAAHRRAVVAAIDWYRDHPAVRRG